MHRLPSGASRITHRMGLAVGKMLAVSATPGAVQAVARLVEERD